VGIAPIIPYHPLSSPEPQQPLQTVLKLGIYRRRSLGFRHARHVHKSAHFTPCRVRHAIWHRTHLTMSSSVMNPNPPLSSSSLPTTPPSSHTPFSPITISSTPSLQVSAPFRNPSPPVCHRPRSTGNDLNATDTNSPPTHTFVSICDSLPALLDDACTGDVPGVPGSLCAITGWLRTE